MTAPFRWSTPALRKLKRLSSGKPWTGITAEAPSAQSKNSSTGPANEAKPANFRSERKAEKSTPKITELSSAEIKKQWDEILVAARSVPSQENVLKAASFGYYKMGEITSPLELILNNESKFTSLTASQTQLVSTLKGLGSLYRGSVTLPPRQTGPSYQAERGRLLYCAHSVAPYNSNGYSTRTAGLVEGMRAAGVDVVVAARPGYPWDVKTDVEPDTKLSFEKLLNGVPHFFSKGPSWTADRLDQYLEHAVDSYVQVAIRTRAAVIQAASNHVTALPALIAARRLGIPFAYEVRGLWEVTRASSSAIWADSEAFHLAKRLETLVAAESDQVFAITEEVRDELVDRGVAEEKILILSNAVNTDSFTPMPPHDATRRALGIEKETPVIGYAGSLVAYEGLDILLEAAKILADEGRDFRIVIVGDGSATPALKAKTEELGLSTHVSFTGRLSPGAVVDYMSLFDIVPCPRLRLPITEMVSPLKPLEAMAAGKAVVLSNLAPLRHIAGTNGERARLFDAGSAADLSKVLGELIDDRNGRLEMGRRARLWTVRERNWTRMGEIVRTSIADSAKWHAAGVVAVPKELRECRLAVVADEFTTTGLQHEAQVTSLSSSEWRRQMESSTFDALIVESAWEGIDESWRGKVGFYDEESFKDLRELVTFCREHSIPTIFWNKEDPVHYNRFAVTARLFDHVFTSDDGSISKYLKSKSPFQKTVASLSFYAQPALHNPLLGERAYNHTVAYAGSYYGDRYRQRSAELGRLLNAAIPSGLSIYDRQHLNPQSPYKFPSQLERFVRGGLPYRETIDTYKSHPVHINVNSVRDSGTMFSRRIYEIAACGGVVLSGPGEGVQKTFGGIIPIAEDERSASVLINYWMNNEVARKEEAWLAMRAVLRSHTAGHRLSYILRTAGLTVSAPKLDTYAIAADHVTKEAIGKLERQSVRPAFVAVKKACPGVESMIEIRVTPEPDEAILESGVPLIGRLPKDNIDRTYFEDLLTTRKYANWSDASYCSDADILGKKGPLVRLEKSEANHYELPGLHAADRHNDSGSLYVSREIKRDTARLDIQMRDHTDPEAARRTTILVAGHDLKFANGIIRHLQSLGHEVLIDDWSGHSAHDEDTSRSLLKRADVIFCEWTLGNAVWYSKNKTPGQRLVTRLHLQEIHTAYLKKLDISAVDQVIFVGKHIADIAQRDFGIPSEKSVVVPNYVPVDTLSLPKTDDARWHIGMVGTIPQRKRLDLALDVLKQLRARDPRYRLFIKGKRADEYPWMKARPTEIAYYDEQDLRIADDPLLQGAVIFDEFGQDMGAWYQKIGTVLSVSDFESFHLTLADGAAAGCVPATLAWAGADQIYPADWISASIAELSESILRRTADEDVWRAERRRAARYAENNFDEKTILPEIANILVGYGSANELAH
ncbi:glycosyltransferase [Arthrobacter luteolus]|uniref:glycosyltransferase n=1 Tax=Arthrobacter luteolus TaxID=98672 RepID=UPI00385048B2